MPRVWQVREQGNPLIYSISVAILTQRFLVACIAGNWPLVTNFSGAKLSSQKSRNQVPISLFSRFRPPDSRFHPPISRFRHSVSRFCPLLCSLFCGSGNYRPVTNIVGNQAGYQLYMQPEALGKLGYITLQKTQTVYLCLCVDFMLDCGSRARCVGVFNVVE